MFFILVILSLVLYCYLQARRPPKYPPGPMNLPIVGSSIVLQKLISRHRNFGSDIQQLGSTYKSTLVGLNMGCEKVVVAYGQSAIDVLLSRSCEGRPDNFFIRQRTMGVRKGITGVDGLPWETHRRFILRSLRNFGYGKSKMELQILETVHDLIETFKNSKTDLCMAPHISMSIMNILWIFVAGENMDKNKAQVNTLLQLLEKRARVFDIAGGLLNQFPWIRFIAPEKSGYSLIKRVNKEMFDFLSNVIKNHKRQQSDNENDDDIISAYLKRIESDNSESFFDDEQLMMVCLDLFIAGSHTTSSFLNVAFYALLLHPEIQKKLHSEIDNAIGKRTLSFSDSKLLPYTMATINEIQRCYSILPMIGPRRTFEDVTIDKYVIPKNTTILISLKSIHMDPAVWEDPETFKPERFLSKENTLINTQNNLTFGSGRRRCIADTFAKHCIFMIFVNVLQHFYIKQSEEGMFTRTFNNGIFVQPKPYAVNLYSK